MPAVESRALVIDGNSLIMRNIMATALQDLKADGTFTGGVYATLNTLRAFLDNEGHDIHTVAMFMDAGVPAWRKELLDGSYKEKRKAKRLEMTEEEKRRAYEQLDLACELLETLGVIVIRKQGWEADDLVAAAARSFLQCAEPPPIIMSGDKDLWQCVAWGACVHDLNRGWIEEANFTEFTDGIPPSLYLTYKAIIGDDSDGISGIYGAGPAKAATLMAAAGEWFLEEDGRKLADLSPAGQWEAIGIYCEQLTKRKKYEEKVLEDHERLHRVLKAIDLSESYDGDDLWKLTLDAPACELRPFLRVCKTLKFASVTSDHQKFYRPFKEVADRHASYPPF